MGKNSIFAKKTQSESGHKSKILVGVMILLFLIAFTSGLELKATDSIKSYDTKTQTINLINRTDLTKNIATIKLNTPIINKVGYGGVFKVAEFEVNSYSNVESALKQIEFYNLNKNMEKIERSYEYKVKGYEGVLVDDYQENCILLKNGTQSCKNEVIGNHIEQKEIWIPLEKIDFSKGEVKTIGIFTYVYKGDKVEWIPTYYGVEIKEWASWSASLDNDLRHYYDFEETSGNILDKMFILNLTTNGTQGVTGKINKAINFTGRTEANTTARNGFYPNVTYSFWIKFITPNLTQTIYSKGNGTTIELIQIDTNKLVYDYGIASGSIQYWTSTVGFDKDIWYHIVINSTGGFASSESTSLYINNQFTPLTYTDVGNNNKPSLTTLTYSRFGMGEGGYNHYINATLDEFAIWNRSLTSEEIADLYNSGLGCTYQNCKYLELTLNSPINYYNSSNQTINFNTSITSISGIQNVSLYIDGILNETNTSGINGTYLFTKILSEDNHNWSILAYDNDSNPTQSGNRYFTIDLTPPILSTTGVTDKYNSTLPINLTWSLFNADANSEKCWYYTSENITNITIICNSSTITNFTSEGNKTIYYFGNDSLGNLASGSSTLFIGYYPYTQSATPENVGSGNAVTFTLYVNGTNLNTLFGSTNATLNFNGTVYTPDTTDRTNQNYTIFKKTLYTTIGNSTGAETPYNWSYNIKNTTSTILTTTTTTQEIKVYAMSVFECSAGDRYILNASIKDEGLNSLINASLNSTKIEIDITVSSRENTSATWDFSKTWLNNETVYVCVPANVLTYSDYRVDWIIGYSADDYVQEFHYMDNGTIDNTNYFNSYTANPLSLMDLELADSTTFLFDFKDEDNLEVDDAIVHVYRYYIGDGIYREVERAEQDDNGETHVHLVEEDVIYYFMVTQYGNIIYTSTNYNAKCLDTPCQISLTASVDFTPFPTNYDEYNGTLFSITSNKTLRTTTLVFSADQERTINFSVFKIEDGVVSYIDTGTETATSGSITLTVPATQGNITYFASVFQDGVFVKSEWVDFRESARDKFGTSGAILGGLMILTLIFMAISEGVVLILIAIVGVIVIGAMQIVELSWLSVISIICAGALIIWKLSQGGRR